MNCIFCSIISGEIPAKLLADSPDAIAIADSNPVAPTHMLIIPKIHQPNLDAYARESTPAALASLLSLATRLGSSCEGGYRLVVNTGIRGGQSVEHVHLHILGGRSMQWPPG